MTSQTELVPAPDVARLTLEGLAAAGLRMMGKNNEAAKRTRQALETGGSALTGEEKAEFWLDVALAEEKLGNIDEAVAAAKEVKAHSDESSPRYMQASAIIASLSLGEDEKAKELPSIEATARKRGFHTVANNIALDLAQGTQNPEEKLKHLERVLSGGGRDYNQVRAIVAKADAIATSAAPRELKAQEVASLANAYSYLHAQRFGLLFDRCHRALWKAFESRSETTQLLRLFRYSSFVWRIRGDEEKEANYLTRLKEKGPQTETSTVLTQLSLELRYFINRLKVVIVSRTPTPQYLGK